MNPNYQHPTDQGEQNGRLRHSVQNRQRPDEPSTFSEKFLRVGSLIPQMILIAIILFVYLSVLGLYAIPLYEGTYSLSDFSADPVAKNNTSSWLIQLIKHQETFYSLIDINEMNSNQSKGLTIILVIHIIGGLVVWSMIRTISTPPGGISSSSRWTREIEEFKQSLEAQESDFQSLFEKKYSYIDTLNQRESKTIPVEEVHTERMNSRLRDENQFQSIFSERSESESDLDDEARLVSFRPSKQSIAPLYMIKENTRESSTSDILNFPKIDQADEPEFPIMDFRSESEVVFEERRDSDLMSENEINAMRTGQILDKDEYDQLLQELFRQYVQQELDRHEYRTCKKCIGEIKPKRTHHCTQCKTCVLKMDHHCQLIDNCVGFYNYKYFLNMLFYGNFEQPIHLTINIGTILTFCSITQVKCYLDASITVGLSDFKIILIALSFFFILTTNLFVLCFTIFHFWLVGLNKTTIEFCENKSDSKKYNLGWFKNMKKVFGDNVFLWFLPVDPKLNEDGAYFENQSIFK